MVILKKSISRHQSGRVTNLISLLRIVTNMVMSTPMIRREKSPSRRGSAVDLWLGTRFGARIRAEIRPLSRRGIGPVGLDLRETPRQDQCRLKSQLQFLRNFRAATAAMTTVTTPNSKRNFRISILVLSQVWLVSPRESEPENPGKGSPPPVLSASGTCKF
jgi:hypothetical protein